MNLKLPHKHVIRSNYVDLFSLEAKLNIKDCHSIVDEPWHTWIHNLQIDYAARA